MDSAGIPQVVSKEQYAIAVENFTKLFADLKEAYPNNITSTTAVPTALLDYLDGDHDLDILQKTISGPPLEFDYYGWQTYMIDNSRGDYPYYHAIQVGKAQFGNKFVPWVGWINTYNDMYDPEYYGSLFRQVRISKMMGVEEVVIAASDEFFSGVGYPVNTAQFEEVVNRLSDLNATRNSTSSAIDIPIYQDDRIYTDLPLYIKKLTPYYFYSQQDIWTDLMCEMDGGWLTWYQIGQATVIFALFYFLEIRHVKNRSLEKQKI